MKKYDSIRMIKMDDESRMVRRNVEGRVRKYDVCTCVCTSFGSEGFKFVEKYYTGLAATSRAQEQIPYGFLAGSDVFVEQLGTLGQRFRENGKCVCACECMCVCVSAVTQRDKTRQHKPLEEIEGEVRCIDIMNYEAMVKCMSIQK